MNLLLLGMLRILLSIINSKPINIPTRVILLEWLKICKYSSAFKVLTNFDTTPSYPMLFRRPVRGGAWAWFSRLGWWWWSRRSWCSGPSPTFHDKKNFGSLYTYLVLFTWCYLLFIWNTWLFHIKNLGYYPAFLLPIFNLLFMF